MYLLIKRKAEVTPSPASAAIIRAHVHQLGWLRGNRVHASVQDFTRHTRPHKGVCVCVQVARVRTNLPPLVSAAGGRPRSPDAPAQASHPPATPSKRDDPPPLPPHHAPVYVRVCRWMSRGALGRGRYQSYLERWRLQERLGGRGEGKGRGRLGFCNDRRNILTLGGNPLQGPTTTSTGGLGGGGGRR